LANTYACSKLDRQENLLEITTAHHASDSDQLSDFGNSSALDRQLNKKEGTGAMYRVFRQLGNGELLHVASYNELEQVMQLVRAFKAHWPGGYLVRDSEGNDVERSPHFQVLPSIDGNAKRNASTAAGERRGTNLTAQAK
jgi:hypothetical protein